MTIHPRVPGAPGRKARHLKVHVERRRPSRPQAYPPGAPRQDRWRWISTAALVVMAVGVVLLVVAAFGAVR